MSNTVVMDIGGTNARIATSTEGGVENIQSYSYDSRVSLEEIVTNYANDMGMDNVDTLVMAIAGDSADPANICFTNGNLAGQRIDMTSFADHVVTINDFTAQGYAPKVMQRHNYEPILKGSNALFIPSEDQPSGLNSISGIDPNKRLTIIGPGTGLGVASAFMTEDGQYIVINGEGGHVSFAPQTQFEFAIVESLKQRFGNVSCETLCSGPALTKTYQAVSVSSGPSLRKLYKSLRSGSGLKDLYREFVGGMSDIKPQDVALRARSGNSDAKRAIDLFSVSLAECAKSLALANQTRGGIIVTGDLYHHVKDIFNYGLFEERLRSNDLPSTSNFMADVPVFAVTESDSGLLGAHAYAQNEVLAPAVQ